MKRLQANCETCQRIETRIRIGIKRRGTPYEKRRPGKLGVPSTRSGYMPRNEIEREIIKAYNRKRHREWYRQLSESQRESRRDYQRWYRMLRRRDAGILPRNFSRSAIDQEKVMRLPINQEFREWVSAAFENQRFFGSKANIGVPSARIYQIIRGELLKIDIDTAERLLIYAHGPLPWEIWPEELGSD